MAEDYAECVQRLRAADPDLAHEVAGFRGIAEVLAVSINTAASRYRYALDKLRQRLRPLYDEIK